MKTGDKSHHLYGTDEGKTQFKTLFNIWRHPSNPTYTSLHNPKPKLLKSDGYALIESELTKAELDDKMLSKENEELEKKYFKTDSNDSNLMVKLEKLVEDENSNYLTNHSDDNNNNNDDNNNNLVKRNNKSQLNVNEVASVKLAQKIICVIDKFNIGRNIWVYGHSYSVNGQFDGRVGC